MDELLVATLETLGMTLISTLLAYLVGLPLGVILNMTSKNGIKPNRGVNLVLGIIVNILRSIPCMILVVILIPLTEVVTGAFIGTWKAMIVPLFFASFAYVARIVEQSLNEVPAEEIEGIKSLGANTWQIITKVLIHEARPSLVAGLAVTAVNIVGYTAFAYDFYNGGIISYVFAIAGSRQFTHLYEFDIWIPILIIVVIVQIIQESGLIVSKKIDKRRKVK